MTHQWLIDIARIGIGLCFIAAVMLDFKLKLLVFKLMAQKKLTPADIVISKIV